MARKTLNYQGRNLEKERRNSFKGWLSTNLSLNSWLASQVVRLGAVILIIVKKADPETSSLNIHFLLKQIAFLIST